MPKNINEQPLKRTYELSFQDSKSLYIAIISKTKKGKLRVKILDYSEFHFIHFIILFFFFFFLIFFFFLSFFFFFNDISISI